MRVGALAMVPPRYELTVALCYEPAHYLTTDCVSLVYGTHQHRH